MPADERPRDLDEQFEEPVDDQIEAAAEQGAEKSKQRGSATIAAAGIAGAAVVGTGAGAAVAGAARAAEYLGTEDDDSAAEAESSGNGEALSGGGFSLDVFTDSAIRSVDVDAVDDESDGTDEDGKAGVPDSSRGDVIVSQPLAPVADDMTDDNRKGQQRNESPPASTPSAVSDATVIAANETRASSVAPTPILSRTNQETVEQAAPPAPAAQSQAPSTPSGTGYDAGSQGAPAVQAQSQTQAPTTQAQPVAQEPSTSTDSSSSPSSSSDIDVIQDGAPTSSEASESSSTSSDVEDMVPTGPASVPESEGVASGSSSSDEASSMSGSTSSSEDSSSSSSSGSMSDSPSGQYGDGGMQYPDNQYGEEHDAQPDYAQQPVYGKPPAGQQYDQDDNAEPGYQQPGYGHKPPAEDAGNQQDQGHVGYEPPIYKPKPPVHADDDNQEEPPYYDNDQQDDYVEDDVVEDDYVEEPVYYDPYYAAFPGNKGYQHPQDLYGAPQPPAEGQAANVYVYRGAAGEDYATIIRDEYGNETITWWYGNPPNGHVVYEVRVEHDGYGNYAEQITSYPVHEVNTALDNIYPNGEMRWDPDVEYGQQYAEEVIDQHLITRTWTDEDGNMVIKKLHRDGSGKIEITYGDGMHVVYEGGQYAYYVDGVLVDGEEYVAPVEEYPVEDVHPLLSGPDYWVDEVYVNPLTAGYDQIGQGDHLQFIDPDTGAKMFVTYLGDGTYTVGWQPDPNAPPGQWEMMINVQVDEYGNYQDYSVVHYTGDLPIYETIPNLGYQSVEGTPYLDPVQEYGFPAENASQVGTDESVVQTWETDAGTITKTYDIATQTTVIEYPDGVVITYNPAVNPYPTYELPGEDVEGDGDIYYYEAGMFGETYADPAGKYPDGPAGTFDENGIQTDYYADGTRVQHYADHIKITWYDAQGNVMLGTSVYDDGYNVDVLPWDYVLSTYGTVLDPIETSHGMYFDPGSNGAIYTQEVQYGMVKHTYPDGTEKVYLTGAQDPGWIQINYPDGTVVVWNGDSIDSVLEGSGDYATPLVDEDGQAIGPDPQYVPDYMPAMFEHEAETYPNPMNDPYYTYTSSSEPTGDGSNWTVDHHYQGPDGPVLVSVHSSGQVEVTFWNGGAISMQVIVEPDGTYAPSPDWTPPPSQEFGLLDDDDDDDGMPNMGVQSVAAQDVVEEEPIAVDPYDIEPWVDHLPPTFTINGTTYINPEAYQGGNNGYTLENMTADTKYYQGPDGQVAAITQQPNGTHLFQWGYPGSASPDLSIEVSPDGSYVVVHDAYAAEEPDDKSAAVEEQEDIASGAEMIGTLTFDPEESTDQDDDEEPIDFMPAAVAEEQVAEAPSQTVAEEPDFAESTSVVDAPVVEEIPEEEPVAQAEVVEMSSDLDDDDDDPAGL